MHGHIGKHPYLSGRDGILEFEFESLNKFTLAFDSQQHSLGSIPSGIHLAVALYRPIGGVTWDPDCVRVIV
ncbi:hypothetical protein [Paenibacillus periandrae]|uniref:hypothetical protein n=1 Tax=Paenibacillus periandrae TaxID=1761741 RepID=UPI001F09571D|nr:hypothetical protein [Paenibacillus periandrae]